jgi:hypothetical protein
MAVSVAQKRMARAIHMVFCKFKRMQHEQVFISFNHASRAGFDRM